MAEALVEEDPQRIRADDMAAIIAALDGIAVTAQPAPSTTTDPSRHWTLTLTWLQKGPVSSDTQAALPQVLTRIREHFTAQDRTPPHCLQLLDQDGTPLVEVTPGSCI
ncbi:hypothetical protein ACEZCY_04455 [Streptacidiphilus sp. N1-12]|uniref:Uncharacterized protein n=2 Tax=Streptacidiphilus alkalitolerans TaxID=3342712 RepID=A0ABV6XEB7_9ACTN